MPKDAPSTRPRWSGCLTPRSAITSRRGSSNTSGAASPVHPSIGPGLIPPGRGTAPASTGPRSATTPSPPSCAALSRRSSSSDCLLHDLFRLPAAVGQSCNTTARPSASVCLRPRTATASRPWSPSARVSANASAGSATAPPAGCGCVTTTGRTTWPPISNRRSRSSGLRVPRALCERPKVTAWRSASSAR